MTSGGKQRKRPEMKGEGGEWRPSGKNQDTKSSSCSCVDGAAAHHGQNASHGAAHGAADQLWAFFPQPETHHRLGEEGGGGESPLT